MIADPQQHGVEQRKALLYCMMRIRCVEETIAARYADQKMRCPTHLCTGQEGVSAGVGCALRSDDFAVSGHRAHGHYLGKGGDLRAMLAEIHGKVTGCCRGKGGSMHLVDRSVGFVGSTAIVGGTIPIGVGLGLSIQLRGTDQVSCVFFGEGATEEGVFYEAVNFAVLRNLPVLFVCENNLYSVYSPLAVRQPEGRSLCGIAGEMGMRAERGYGNDVLEVYAKAQQAILSIREGTGPVFLEFATYRHREHCGPNLDDDLGYQPEDERQLWLGRDPISRFQRSLLVAKTITDRDLDAMAVALQRDVDEAFEFAEASSFPEPTDAYEGVYA
ncbi:MAG: thiamine pyrophosphate-dependent dehydrogenase E1 component subunit alpha [Lentisphaerae bacterium]|nr:thiamine pyrophosphate-dependent dehydrogenase E1 component subunit alpha [Lentisphaerota bacterium]